MSAALGHFDPHIPQMTRGAPCEGTGLPGRSHYCGSPPSQSRITAQQCLAIERLIYQINGSKDAKIVAVSSTIGPHSYLMPVHRCGAPQYEPPQETTRDKKSVRTCDHPSLLAPAL